jgi:hypothetical protein
MFTGIISSQSNFSIITRRVAHRQYLAADEVSNLLEQALRQYKLHTKKHELPYQQLLEIWERDCEPMLHDLDLAA